MQKNKLSTVIIFFLLGAVCSTIISYTRKSTSEKKNQISPATKVKIALITRLSSYHEGAIKGFTDSVSTLFKGIDCSVRRYILAKRDLQLAASLIDEAVADRPDLIVTIGALLSQTARSVTSKRGKQIPVVFIGATNPIKLGLLENINSPNTNMTGINMTDIGEDMAVQVMKILKPYAKHVLLPYSPLSSGGEVEQHVFNAKEVLENQGTKVTLIPVDELSEVLPKIRGLISSADTVMYLPGCLVEEAAEGLIKLCNQHGVSLFANQPQTVKQGAAFGYGTDTSILGAKACEIARSILIEGKDPKNIPVQFMDFGRRTAVNLDAAKQQNLHIPEELLFFISRGVIYKDGKEV